jgi:hypothetical protein
VLLLLVCAKNTTIKNKMTDTPLKIALEGLFIGGAVGFFMGLGIAGKFDQRTIDYVTPNKIVAEDTRAYSINQTGQTNGVFYAISSRVYITSSQIEAQIKAEKMSKLEAEVKKEMEAKK